MLTVHNSKKDKGQYKDKGSSPDRKGNRHSNHHEDEKTEQFITKTFNLISVHCLKTKTKRIQLCYYI